MNWNGGLSYFSFGEFISSHRWAIKITFVSFYAYMGEFYGLHR